jgi:hypothetical protein
MGALSERQAAMKALHEVALATLETLGEAGNEGAPAGVLFAAMQAHGATKGQFDGIVEPMTLHGFLRRDGDRLRLTEAGEAFMVTLRGKKFRVDASNRNPTTRTGHEAGNLVDYTPTESRTAAAQLAKTYHGRGYWVEVYDSRSNELLAGPFDPDKPLPKHVVF